LFFCLSAASSCNTYTKTFSGIDGAGKRLADEVSADIVAKYIYLVFTYGSFEEVLGLLGMEVLHIQ
jgi:hypothetical protein